MFFELDTSDFKKILSLYLREDIIFPLMLAVVQQQQRGWVFVDNLAHPTSALVINNFGFMQLIGAKNSDDNLYKFFKSPTTTIPTYLLWYSPPLQTQKILDGFTQVRRRERARFVFKGRAFENPVECPAGFTVQRLDKESIGMTQTLNLEIGSRFWASTNDFLEHGIGTCIIKDGKIVSLCYSACVVNNLAEVDVVTKEEYRGMGLAVIAAQSFISECVQRDITPTWDCFVNNIASMNLAIKLGFKKERTYPFYSFTVPINFVRH